MNYLCSVSDVCVSGRFGPLDTVQEARQMKFGACESIYEVRTLFGTCRGILSRKFWLGTESVFQRLGSLFLSFTGLIFSLAVDVGARDVWHNLEPWNASGCYGELPTGGGAQPKAPDPQSRAGKVSCQTRQQGARSQGIAGENG